jgi:NhaA family Na+:H+ antiporter
VKERIMGTGQLTFRARFAAPPGIYPRLGKVAEEYLVALPAGVLIALLWSAAHPESYYRMTFSASFLVNDVAMVFFFALITKEIVEATLPGGVLHPWRRAAMPALAAAAASIVSLTLFAFLIRAFDEPMLDRGRIAVLSVDVAFGYFVARLIFGRHPAVSFFLLLAIAANGFGFAALAVSEPIRETRPWLAIGLMTASLTVAAWLRRRRVTRLWPYLGVSGALSWLALLAGGVHPALALLPIVPFLPHAARDRGFFVDARRGAPDTMSRLDRFCHYPAQVALFLFAVVNAGVSVGSLEAGMWALPLATLTAKPAGVLLGAAVGVAAGLHLPRGVAWRELIVVGFISAIGFTMALFFATATIGPGHMLAEMKVGALMTAGGALAAFGAARLLQVGRFSPNQ